MLILSRNHRLAPAMLVMALLLCTFGSPVFAQDSGPVVQSASLRLWPEYDDPGLLVITAGSLGDSTTYPFQLSLPIPDGARGIQATVNDPAQGLMNREWSLEDSKLTYALDLPDYHVEYYVDRPPSGEQREIRYTFEAPYRMDGLEVTVQQPARATDFTLDPPPTGSFVGSDGLTYHTFSQENLAAGDRLDIAIRYKKTDNALSQAAPVVAATQPAPESAAGAPSQSPTASASSTPEWLPYVLIGAGLLAIAAIVAYYLLQQRRPGATASHPAPARAKPPRPTVSASSSPQGARATSEPGVFCTQCGRRFGADERFCAQCGAPRRA